MRERGFGYYKILMKLAKRTSIFNSAVKFSIQKKENSPLGDNKFAYDPIYLSFKSQSTFLLNSINSLNDLIKKESNSELISISEFLIGKINYLLNIPFHSLSKITSETIIFFQENANMMISKPEYERIYSKIVSILAYLSKLISIFSNTGLDDENKIEEDENDLSLSDDDNNIDSIVCRICNEKVPFDLLEEHTESCIYATQTGTQLLSINTELKYLINYFSDKYLNQTWNGQKEICVSICLPIFHLVYILEYSILIDPQNIEAPNELSKMALMINKINFSGQLHHETEIKCRCKHIILSKKSLSETVQSAMEVLRSTRISGCPFNKGPPSVCDFQFIKLISRGANARVFLARKRATEDIYAIKVIQQDEIHKKNQMKRILTEKDILLQFNNKYLINFYFSIIGNRNLYLVMEYVPGGDLFSILNKVGLFDEISTKFYTFQIVKALKYLHSNGIIHRDLKPDNLLITSTGFIKLADFGLSFRGSMDVDSDSEKIIESKSIVGTPDYTAPEIILCQTHSFTVDYWSLGIIIYEMLTGITPFKGDNEQETYNKILTGKYEEISPTPSKEAIDLISSLLQLNPKKRLGYNGIDSILKHKWFADINENNMKPPFVPIISNPEDTCYFENRYSTEIISDQDIQNDIEEAQISKTHQSIPNLSVYLDDLGEFPSISVQQLGYTNREVLQKMVRNRATSFAELKNERHLKKSDIPLPLINNRPLPNIGLSSSTSFSNINSKRKRNSSGLSSSDDSVICTPR